MSSNKNEPSHVGRLVRCKLEIVGGEIVADYASHCISRTMFARHDGTDRDAAVHGDLLVTEFFDRQFEKPALLWSEVFSHGAIENLTELLLPDPAFRIALDGRLIGRRQHEVATELFVPGVIERKIARDTSQPGAQVERFEGPDV